jgi:hypothetical protein
VSWSDEFFATPQKSGITSSEEKEENTIAPTTSQGSGYIENKKSKQELKELKK